MMIMRTNDTDESASYRILDSNGRLLGRVQAPEGPPSLGPGAGTVLLVRERVAARPLAPA
jgi:hypothetical protein